MDKNVKVYYPQLGIHTYMQSLIDNPPKGYEFVTIENPEKKKFIASMKKSPLAVWAYTKIFKKTFNVFGLINKIYYQKSPVEAKLILSTGPLIDEEKPWILKILDTPFSLGGNDYHVFLKNRDRIEKALLSPYCKKILVHSKACFLQMKKYFNREVMKKVQILIPAIPGELVERKVKDKNEGITLLFMGSINNPGEFLMKGGLEALESFRKIKEKYPKTKLIMRCKVPQDIKERYKDLEGIEFMEQKVSYEELKSIYLRSDTLLMPGYGYFIMAFLEAFQNGLPIISLDTYGVKEFVEQGKTGFYVSPSNHVPTKVEEYPANVRSDAFAKSVMQIDNKVIYALSKKIEKIILDRDLLEKMSAECQKAFKDKYSYSNKVNRLREIFNEALT
ncbi:glycosyltransferase family 4 protein [Candidatus Pacearchaeota archaeon]|nr:glycosyltransferase family 4 protein [Candidatus Pacearchaeota archaeon]